MNKEIINTIRKNINIDGIIVCDDNGIKKEIMLMHYTLYENGTSYIKTYILDKELFLKYSDIISEEVGKFKDKAKIEAKELNCLIF